MSEIKVNSVVNSTGDNDSGLDLSTNDNIKFKIANAEKAVQMVKGFLDAMGLKPSDKMAAVAIFGQTVEKLAQIEANKK